MSGVSNARVIVAGAGAFGSAIALRLAQAGARVTLVDPDLGLACGASAVAAGMLAPAFESVLDPETNLSFDLLRAARDLWPAFATRLGGADIGLSQAGACWFDLPGLEPRAGRIAEALSGLGAHLATPPALPVMGAADVFTPEDWRLSPRLSLAALHGALREAGGETVSARVGHIDGVAAVLSDGERLRADRIVLATGMAATPLVPELSRLVPIKGQILSYPDVRPAPGAPAIRCAGGYAVGGADGLFVGATMEVGLCDLAVDPATTQRLHALAGRLNPECQSRAPLAVAAVRAASPDGRPLVGPSRAQGVLLAAGARRNGWLLAPLVAQMIAAYLADADPGPYASLFGSGRFDIDG